MKILILMPALFIVSCSQGVKARNENDNSYYYIDSLPIDSLKNDTCDMHNMYTEFELFKKALISKKADQIANFFDFPINDPGVLTFINSEITEQNQHISISNFSDFQENIDKIFPNEFLSLIKKVTLSNTDGDEEYKEVEWENYFTSQNSMLKRYKMLYKINNNIVNFRFIIENHDEIGKYETVIEYFFKLKSCRLKFEKSIIAG